MAPEEDRYQRSQSGEEVCKYVSNENCADHCGITREYSGKTNLPSADESEQSSAWEQKSGERRK